MIHSQFESTSSLLSGELESQPADQVTTRQSHPADSVNGPTSVLSPLLREEIRYVMNDGFHCSDGVQEILESLDEHQEESAETSCLIDHNTQTDSGVLSPEQERRLFLRMNCLRYLAERHRKRSLNRGCDSRVEKKIRNLLDEAEVSRNQILLANQGLVYAIAHKIKLGTHEVEELVNEGNLILMRAIDCFDVSRGFRFSTYATHSVRRHLFRFQRKERTLAKKSQPHISDPTVEETSLDWVDQSQEELVIRLLDEMPDRERYVVVLRFGLDQREEFKTYREIAEILDISAERVRQIVKSVCRKLQLKHASRLGY